MVMYYLSDSLRKAYECSHNRSCIERYAEGSQIEAIKLFEKVAKGYIGLGAVQGPPGTGKTSVFDLGTRGILDEILGYKGKILYLYIAPTNHLVIEAFTRFVANLFYKGYDVNVILDLIRVYGSKIEPCRKGSMGISIDNKILPCDKIKKLMKSIDPRNVRFVFATEYQRISPKLVEKPDEIRFIVDEASKTPFFRVFLPIARSIIRNPEEAYPKSMIVLGDPQQAISISTEFKTFRIPLLMDYIKRILERRNLEEYYKFLDTTFRLPGPTETPISRGFYEGKLKAKEHFKVRYNKLLAGGLEDVLNKSKTIMGKILDLSKSSVKLVVEAIDKALTNGIPLIVFKTRKFPSGDTYHRSRAYLGYLTGLYLSIISIMLRGGRPAFGVSLTAPYSDLAYSTGYYLKKKLVEAGIDTDHLRYATVQSIIGGEDDVIVTMLGKEWLARNDFSYYSFATIRPETMYFNEHQVLNVQLSRHRLLMIIIGNTDKLKRSAHHAKIKGKYIYQYRIAGESIEKTIEGIELLKENGNVISKSFRIV
ncbi:hypothetical protein [Staphylothermus hellenicus]|uniref:DNA helicase n=1 Tax=Staphylothermus hellenicus (strain DSM 12710 / JCM 10830 / BK20S6-10-b1 / P8) TaxID=591019 RepID=D7DAZ6_STAHD|nr:hypothetical protein [Staphylothermus hellenicus]ADI31343.1 hypothetical protein Shell_0202 [Staphylothermus hellenicus DSM 12710]